MLLHKRTSEQAPRVDRPPPALISAAGSLPATQGQRWAHPEASPIIRPKLRDERSTVSESPPLIGLPLVTDQTRAQSENIETVVARLRSGRLQIPDYQRDNDQWDQRKESLFIESLLNNLTVPAFFFAQVEGSIEVVDGQQRLSTISKFANGDLRLSNDESVVYLTPQSVHYRGKIFSELPLSLQAVFNDYPLTIIYLPTSLDLGTKLEYSAESTKEVLLSLHKIFA